MSDFYTEMQAVASEVLTEFAQGTITYVKITPGSGPKTNPGPSTRTPYAVKGAAQGITAKYVAMNLAQASDLQVIAAVDARYTPSVADIMIIDGKDYKIVQILPKPAAGTPVAYLLIVRRG